MQKRKNVVSAIENENFFYFLNLLAGVVYVFCSVLYAQPVDILQSEFKTFKMEIGLGSQHPYDNTTRYIRQGQWVPLLLDITTQDNPGSLEGVIRSNIADTYTLRLSAPAHSQKRLIGYIFCKNVSQCKDCMNDLIGYNNCKNCKPQVAIDIYDNGEKISTSYLPLPFLLPEHQEMVLVVTGSDTFITLAHKNLNLLYYYTNPQRWARQVVWSKPERFPIHWSCLAEFRAIIFDNIGDGWKNFSQPQYEALTNYIESGGTLIFCGGPFDIYLRDPRLKNLLPVRAEQLKKTRLIWQGNALTEIQLRESIPLPDAETLCRTGDYPFLVSKKRGLGKIFFMATGFADAGWLALPSDSSVTDPHIDEITQNSLSSYILRQSSLPVFHYNKFHDKNGKELHNTLRELTSIPVPSDGAIGLFLSFYFLAFLLNYAIWKKFGKASYAWFTFVLIAAVFSAILFKIGQETLSDTLSMNTFSLFATNSNTSISRVSHYTSILSQKTATYEFSVPDRYWIFPLDTAAEKKQSFLYNRPIALDCFAPTTVRDCLIYSKDVRTFLLQGIMEIGDGVKTSLNIQENELTGTIHNKTSYTLNQVWFVLGEKVCCLGNICPDQKLEIARKIEWQPISFDKALEKDKFGQEILSTILMEDHYLKSLQKNSNPYLIGISKDSISPIQGLKYHTTHSVHLFVIFLPNLSGNTSLSQKMHYYWHVFDESEQPILDLIEEHFSLDVGKTRYIRIYFPNPNPLMPSWIKNPRTIKVIFSTKPYLYLSRPKNLQFEAFNFKEKSWNAVSVRFGGQEEPVQCFLYPERDYICPMTSQILMRCSFKFQEMIHIQLKPKDIVLE